MHSVCLLCFFRFTLRLGSGNGCLLLFSNTLKGAPSPQALQRRRVKESCEPLKFTDIFKTVFEGSM